MKVDSLSRLLTFSIQRALQSYLLQHQTMVFGRTDGQAKQRSLSPSPLFTRIPRLRQIRKRREHRIRGERTGTSCSLLAHSLKVARAHTALERFKEFGVFPTVMICPKDQVKCAVERGAAKVGIRFRCKSCHSTWSCNNPLYKRSRLTWEQEEAVIQRYVSFYIDEDLSVLVCSFVKASDFYRTQFTKSVDLRQFAKLHLSVISYAK